MRAHLLLTEVDSDGGVQRYGRALYRTLGLMTAAHGSLRAFTLNDASAIHGIAAFGHDRRRFATAALGAAHEDQPDVIILGHINLVSLAPAYRVVAPVSRLYVVAHGVEIEGRLTPMRALGLRTCRGVLCVSEATRALMVRRHRVHADRATLLPYGFQPPEAPPARPDQGIQLLSVSRLCSADAYKGIDTVIEAVASVASRHPDLHLTVVGDGDDLVRLVRLTRTLGIAARVTFTGRVPDDRLQELYAASDIFVLPSDHEGLGIVYLEAMAHGLPVIGVHAGGVPDAVVHEANGLLVPRREPELVARAIDRLASDAALRRRLGDWGKRHTLPRFSSEQMLVRLSEAVGGLAATQPVLGESW
jgi:glycosyltransferase involved in cell wall biosynthesis